MIKIETFVVNMVQENCYVVSDETKEAVIIDCGALSAREQDEITRYIEQEGLTVKHLLNTHCHFDHVFGVNFMHDTYGLLPLFHKNDLPLYQSTSEQLKQFMRINKTMSMPEVTTFLDLSQPICWGCHQFEVIETPGHSPGGVCFYCAAEKILFSGDSLFYHEIGRSDFEYGDHRTLVHNLETKILPLPPETVVYPGHGRPSTIGEERLENPYLHYEA